MNKSTRKIIAFLMAIIMMMSAFSSYACIAASAASYETVSIADIFTAGKEKQAAQKAVTPDKETEEEPLEETSDLNFMEDVRNYIRRVIEIIKAIFAFFFGPRTPEPEPELFK
ncbi:MAG: hypothetical protein IKH13_04405 [Clostridia bacterium]|nr:hypothetical protein [Clostridia bacterium]